MMFVAPLWTRPVITADTLTFYLGKLVWPISLGPDYGRTPQVVLEQGWEMLQGLVPVGLGLIVWWGWRRLRWLKLAAGVFIVGLLPVLGFVPFMFQAISTVADRYVYLALLGPALGLAWGIRQIGRWRGVWVGLGLVFTLLGLCTGQQVRVWQNTVTLFTRALQVNPRSVLAYNNLGLALAQHGQLDAAITQYRAALRINPNAVEAHYNLGNALQRQGQRAQAITHYTEAVRLKPHWVEAYNNLGNTLDDDGRAEEAITYYQAALRLQPDFAEAHNNLGTAWLKQGRLTEALEQFRIATHLKPTWAEAYYNLGLVFDRQGKAGEAIAAYWTAHRLRPGWPQVALPLAWLLVRQQPASAPAVAEAIALAEQACQATAYQDATALYVLAVAYQTAGDEARARTTAQHALSLATAAGNIPFSTRIAAEFLSTVQ
jgi:protein O-mannosyl-transferase